jgi:hypothetical protein
MEASAINTQLDRACEDYAIILSRRTCFLTSLFDKREYGLHLGKSAATQQDRTSSYLLLNGPGMLIRSVRVRPFSVILDRV